eukprot:4203-Heterococcus_DN1.PRE.2
MSIDSVKRKLDSMLSEIDEDDERELEDAIQPSAGNVCMQSLACSLADLVSDLTCMCALEHQGVKNKRTARAKAKREAEERMKHLHEVCEGSEEASVRLHALTSDCMICLNKLFQADEGEWGAVKLQCGGCTKPPVLHVACMIKLQNQRGKCPQCREPFTNARATATAAAAAASGYAGTWGQLSAAGVYRAYSPVRLDPYDDFAFSPRSPTYSPTAPAYRSRSPVVYRRPPPPPGPPTPPRWQPQQVAAAHAAHAALAAATAAAPSTGSNGEPLYTVEYHFVFYQRRAECRLRA